MGTVLKVLGLLFMIHTNDHKPPHVTVYKGTPENFEARVRIEIETLSVMDSETAFSAWTLRKIVDVVRQNQETMLEEWNETRPK